MKHLIFIGIFLFCTMSSANLLSSIQIEESYRQKVQSYVELFDSEARVVLKLEYKKIEGTLPGTALNAANETPTVIDSNDIERARVLIISRKQKFGDNFESLLKGLLPVASSKVTIVFQQKTSDMDPREKENLRIQDLRNLATESLDRVLQHFTVLVLSVFGISALIFSFFSMKSLKEFKSQMSQMQEAIAAQAATPVSPAILTESGSSRSYSASIPQIGSEDLISRQISKLDSKQMLAILSDCYWCHLDGEAAWLWKRMEIAQKRELISLWKPLEEYSKFLLSEEEIPAIFWQDSFYYSAQDIKDLDNTELAKIIEGNPQAWYAISSVRQKHIPVSLELGLKLSSVQMTDDSFIFSNKIKCTLRSFDTASVVSDLTLEDEMKILNNPEFIPNSMRKNVPSLCWLASKDSDYISSVLAQFDAKALATAWVGPEEVLKKFEGFLSEKKLKALHSYLLVAKPSRKSASFMKLHQLGITHEAA